MVGSPGQDGQLRRLGTISRGIDRSFRGLEWSFYSLIVTFAAVDWVMMLDPHFFSTIWGLLFRRRLGVSCFCFAVIDPRLSVGQGTDGPRARHDGIFTIIGKLMLALIMVWAYFNFSQFLIIWSGNIPEETVWFLARTTNGWGYIAWGLFYFISPHRS